MGSNRPLLIPLFEKGLFQMDPDPHIYPILFLNKSIHIPYTFPISSLEKGWKTLLQKKTLTKTKGKTLGGSAFRNPLGLHRHPLTSMK